MSPSPEVDRMPRRLFRRRQRQRRRRAGHSPAPDPRPQAPYTATLVDALRFHRDSLDAALKQIPPGLSPARGPGRATIALSFLAARRLARAASRLAAASALAPANTVGPRKRIRLDTTQ
ncbi:hypothetical protein H696_01707 [Fonticula alba]|uniref:Uncharacterized protein n=1 Tax=Fonticula alba TaxID=691883 RepID=A0A058ZED8_FONAL|nr:hypothetical protein H696_01707 [Fonticula alba]KCV72311.1 hypothetical protein H696_01707 [Fonticula alba]|eukprot:XP_009493889.1 hypothetical protein H696_01707 [Fonticula alba]